MAIGAGLIERARVAIIEPEIEVALAVLAARRHPVIMPIRPPGVLSFELGDHLVDRVEAVDDGTIAEDFPAAVLTALDTDVDDHDGGSKQAARDRPPGETSIFVEVEID